MMLIAGIIGSIFLSGLTVGVLRKLAVAGFATPDSFGSVVVDTLSFQGAALIFGCVFVKLHDIHWHEVLGLPRPKMGRALLMAAGVLVISLPLVWGLQQVSILTLEKLGWLPETQNAVDLFLKAKSPWMRIYLGFFAVVLAPFGEEFVFRGVLFPFVKQLGWPKLAWFGVSFLFALIHVNLPTILPLFVLALIFTWLYHKTNCLLTSILAHSLFNAANLVLLCFLHP